eukprot:Phypoly_transcript_06033.p1 GENE.Phypoly_transcript_06033~~Phypoly_transcript_06033.p1  ORF type:complete len:198 (+),score=24.07 Phypoly_transcript_06033:1067-1660(+)
MDYLSDTVLKGLEVIGGGGEEGFPFPEAEFKKLVDVTVNILLLSQQPSELLGAVGGDPIQVKQGHASLSEFFLEAAKLNADPSVLSGILEEHKVAAGHQTYLLDQYKTLRPLLRKQLAQTLFHPPKVVDVDWRLDYFLKANSVEKINVPIYRIVLLTTKQDGTTGPVELACTLEQLQDLVAKLRDATKQIDRSAGRA